MTHSAYVDGRRVEGSGPERSLVDPATGDEVDRLHDAGPDEVEAAIVAARRASAGPWSEATPGERAEVLLRLADLVERSADELADIEVAETGKAMTTVREGELPFGVDNLRFFAGAARSLAGTGAGSFSRGYTSLMTRRPVGVVGAICPWNFPTIIAIWKATPAIAAGCTVVLKPAPTTPRAPLLLAELATEAGLPDGVLNVVTGGDDVGTTLVEHPDIDMITFTGSTTTGRAVMRGAAGTLKRLHLELGGKAPALVFADADIAQMAGAVTLGATYNTGQDCTAATRVYVERSRFDDAVEALRDAMASVRVGDPRDPDTDIGPLVSTEHRERVHAFVERARGAGAEVVCGGAIPEGPGAYYPPTLITGVEQGSEIVQDEVFGPVLVALPFPDGDEAEALRLANDVRYGLASSVWTTDAARGLRVSRRLDYGVTWMNDHLPIASEMPHGGVKASGFGEDLSEEAVRAYTVPHHTMVKHTEPDPRQGFRPA